LLAQSIAVGTNTPNAASIMDLVSTNKGVLIPRLTTAQRNAIAGLGVTHEGLLIYNASTDEFNYWDGTQWVAIAAAVSNNWTILGNAGTVDGTNFIGTTDDRPFNIRVNNQKAGRINSVGTTFFGYQAGNVNTEDINTGIGYRALYSNTLGSNNTAIGYQSLNNNTTGNNNTALGYYSLRFNVNGTSNTGLGFTSLRSNSTGSNNTGVGFQSLFSNTTGSNNTVVGYLAMTTNVDGPFNTAMGTSALYSNTQGSYNVGIGSSALYANNTGAFNTALGYYAGYFNVSITTGQYNTFLGYTAQSDNASRSNCIAIAGNSNLNFGASNRVRVGNSSITSIAGQVNFTGISDERIKENVQEDVKGLEFILKLRPVTYYYSIEKSNQVQGLKDNGDWEGKYDIEKMKFSGFLAQEVDRAAKEIGYDFSGVDKSEEPTGLWGLRYAEFTVPLVKAVQELHELNKTQQTQIEFLIKQNEAQQAQIDALLKAME
jgi:hypothetical protein